MSAKLSKRAKRSYVWTYFQNIDSDLKKALCDICKNIVSYSGNNTNLKFHMERHHIAEWSALINENNENKSQTSLTNYFNSSNNIQSYTTDSKAHNEITRKLIKMIVMDLQPFSVVEDKGFQDFVKRLDPRYELPTRKYLSGKCLDSIYNSEVTKLLNVLSEIDDIHLTTDMWTDSHNQTAYITITCHYIDNNINLRHATLKTINFDDTHTGEHICAAIQNTLEEFNISNHVQGVVTDNGSNVVCAVRLGNWWHLPCFAHTINLIVQNALHKIESIKLLTNKCRHIISIFKRSAKATSILNEKQIEMGLVPPRKLKQDVKTRWNSTLIMIRSILLLKTVLPTVLSLLDGDDIPILVFSDWQLIEKLVQLLTPFEEVTIEMSAENFVTSSKIIPIIKCLTQQLSIMHFTNEARLLHDEVLKDIDHRLGKADSNIHLVLATLLDPRFKDLIISEENAKKYKRKLVDIVLKKIEENEMNASNPVDENLNKMINNLETTQNDENLVALPKLWTFLDNKVASKVSDNESTLRLAELEVKQYFDLNVIRRTENPLNWWRTEGAKFPNLLKIARNYLALPATSVPSERVFSKSGLLINDKRSRLKPNKVNKIIFLNMNLE